MDSFDQMMQALEQYLLPNCTKQNHVDNLILIKNDKDNNCLIAQCGECDKNNKYENEKISTKYFFRLIIEQLYSKNLQQNKEQIKSNLDQIENLIWLLKNNQKFIDQEIEYLNKLKQEISKYQSLQNITAEIKQITASILLNNYEHKEFQNKINQLSKLVKVNSTRGEQSLSINLIPYKFDYNSYQHIEDQLKQTEFKLSQLEVQFDINYSSRFFNFDKGNNIAIFNKNSENFQNDFSQIKYYNLWPVLRVNQLIKSGVFKIKFKMNQKGYFGLGTPELPPNGFPGYTKFGYIHCTQGEGTWYNNAQLKNEESILTNSENIVNTEVLYYVDADNHECSAYFNGKFVKRKYPLANPVYVIFSLKKGQVELIK